MTKEQIEEAVSAYIKIDVFEEVEREYIDAKIEQLRELRRKTYERDIYKDIYKPEYGDYKAFLLDVAVELREVESRNEYDRRKSEVRYGENN